MRWLIFSLVFLSCAARAADPACELAFTRLSDQAKQAEWRAKYEAYKEKLALAPDKGGYAHAGAIAGARRDLFIPLFDIPPEQRAEILLRLENGDNIRDAIWVGDNTENFTFQVLQRVGAEKGSEQRVIDQLFALTEEAMKNGGKVTLPPIEPAKRLLAAQVWMAKFEKFKANPNDKFAINNLIYESVGYTSESRAAVLKVYGLDSYVQNISTGAGPNNATFGITLVQQATGQDPQALSKFTQMIFDLQKKQQQIIDAKGVAP